MTQENPPANKFTQPDSSLNDSLLLETLVELSPTAVLIADCHGSLIKVNDRACNLLGYRHEELLGQAMSTLLLPEVASHATDHTSNKIRTYRHKNGSPILVEVSSKTLADGSWMAVVQACDSTEQVHAAEIERLNQELARRVDELQTILDTVPVGLAIADDPTCEVVRVNQFAQAMLTVPPDANVSATGAEAETLPFRQLRNGKEIPGKELPMQLATAQGVEVRDVEIQLVRADGVTFDWLVNAVPLFNEQGAVRGCVAAFIDISERRQVEATLREGEDRFRTLADNIAQLAWIADATGWIFWYNKRWFDYTGKTISEMEGWGWQAVHHPEHVDRVTERFRHCIEMGESWEDTFPLRGQDGRYRWFLSRAFPIRNEQGQVLRWFGTNTDISDRKHLEDVLEARTTELSRINRLKDEFLAALSHELRTPLNPILGWTTMLRSQKLSPEKTAQALETIERNVRQQITLVDDLLDVSRIVQGKLTLKLQPLDLVNTLTAAIETVQFAAQAKAITIQLHGSASLHTSGDGGRLQQVFWNLLSNAIKFTPEGGQIEVRLEGMGNGAWEMEHREMPNHSPSYAQITITDTGIGIAPEFLPHVFDHFRQADGGTTRRFGGLGLGLAIVKHLVELHGGNITAASVGIGRGATFTIKLPLLGDRGSVQSVDPAPNWLDSSSSEGFSSLLPSPVASTPLVTSPTNRLAGIQILLLDDEPDNLELLQFLLSGEGAIVTPCTSPLEALELIAQTPPDLLFSDIGMPEMNGYEFIRRVRALPAQQGGQVPAVALTAFAQPSDREQAIASGFQAYIAKPLDLSQVLTTVKQFIPHIRPA